VSLDRETLPDRRTVGVALAALFLVVAVVAGGAGLYFAVGLGPDDEAAVSAVESSEDVTVERLDGATVGPERFGDRGDDGTDLLPRVAG